VDGGRRSAGDRCAAGARPCGHAGADVLVHNFRPGVPERLGIGYAQVSACNPRIVYVSATGYGETGPYAHRPSAHPAAGAALGGVLWQAGAAMPPATVDGADEIDEIKEIARRFYRANELNPDPNTSLAIASASRTSTRLARRLSRKCTHSLLRRPARKPKGLPTPSIIRRCGPCRL